MYRHFLFKLYYHVLGPCASFDILPLQILLLVRSSTSFYFKIAVVRTINLKSNIPYDFCFTFKVNTKYTYFHRIFKDG